MTYKRLCFVLSLDIQAGVSHLPNWAALIAHYLPGCSRGQVRTIHFTPENFRILSPSEAL